MSNTSHRDTTSSVVITKLVSPHGAPHPTTPQPPPLTCVQIFTPRPFTSNFSSIALITHPKSRSERVTSTDLAHSITQFINLHLLKPRPIRPIQPHQPPEHPRSNPLHTLAPRPLSRKVSLITLITDPKSRSERVTSTDLALSITQFINLHHPPPPLNPPNTPAQSSSHLRSTIINTQSFVNYTQKRSQFAILTRDIDRSRAFNHPIHQLSSPPIRPTT